MADSARIEELRRRVQSDPASIAFAALAEEYRRAGRYKESVATCKAGLQRHPAYLSARVTLGRSLIELGQYDEAARELEHVVKAAPDNLAAIRALADIHNRRGELLEAETDTTRPSPAASPATAHPSPPLRPTQTGPAAGRPVQLSVASEGDSDRAGEDVSGILSGRAPAEGQQTPHQESLAALEAFLAAIIRARESARGGPFSTP
jgi:tetratricopeptide (TPR) repeat protein